MALQAGSWKIGGIRLPEFGITERIQRAVAPQRSTTAQGGSNLLGSSSYAAPQSQILGAQTQNPYAGAQSTRGSAIPTNPITGGGGGGSVGGSGAQSGYNQQIQNVQSQGDQGADLIEQDYNNALGMLAGQEQSLRGQAGTAEGQIENEAGAVRSQLTREQGVAEQGVQSNLSTSEKEGTNAMQQARDLFRQTQQGNIAQLSALGISSSSVAEALAERLGVETARRIAGVTGSLQEVRENATKEMGRIKDYYTSKVTEVQQQVQVQKANIQNSLIAGLNQINSARQQAATDKARSRAELLNNVQNQIFQLTQQEQQFQQSLKQWAEKKSAALTPMITDPNFVNSLTQATSTFNQQFAPQGFNYAPEVSTDEFGRVRGSVNYNLQKKPDEFANPFK